MYRPINITIKEDRIKQILESFDMGSINSIKEGLLGYNRYDSYYAEAVFANGKQSVEPIVKNLEKIKNLLDEEIAKQEASEKRDGRNAEKFNPKAYWRHQYFKELEDAFGKVFGFRSVQMQPFIERYNSKDQTFESREINMMIYNNDRYPIDGLVTDKGFYDKTHSINIEIYITLGLIKAMSPEELMAVVLHEFGHAIDPALVDINYTNVNILSKYLTDRKDKLNSTEKKVIAETGKKHKLGDGVMMIIFLMCYLAVFAIPALISWLRDLIIGKEKAEQKRLDKIKKLIQQIDTEEFTRQNFSEAFADNFARMYGYGPQLATAFKKMAKDNEKRINSWFTRERSRQRCIVDLVSATLKDEHKTDVHRIKNLIKEYYKDIDDPNTPAVVKKQLKEDVAELEKVLDEYMNDFSDFQNKVNKVISDEIDRMFPLDKDGKSGDGQDSGDDKKDTKGKSGKQQEIKEGYEFFDESKKAYEKLMKRSQTVTSKERAEFRQRFGDSKACSLAKDKDGYYVYTHRCRSKSYPTIADIPQKDVDFVRSTA